MSSVSRGGSGYASEDVSYQTVILIYFLVQFICWALLEFFEHKLRLQPAIRRRSSFSRMAELEMSNTSDKKHFRQVSRRVTKSLGIYQLNMDTSIY